MSKEQCNKLIREKLPHLQELSFGCAIRRFEKNYLFAWLYVDEDTDKMMMSLLSMDWQEYIGLISVWQEGKYEILWHPIQINDWLGLLEWYMIDSYWFIIHSPSASFSDAYILQTWNIEEKWQPLQYDLSKPFDSQSEPFYLFLLENIT